MPVSSLFADESSDEDIFSSSKKQHKVTANSNPSQKVVPIINPPITSSSSTNNAVHHKVPSRSNNPVKKPVPVKKSIFDDSESEDDIFASKISTNRSQNKPVSGNGSIFKPEPKKLNVPVPANKRTSLFSDDSDSDSDLFGNKRSVLAKPKMASSVAPAKMEDTKVDTVLDDDNIFKSDTPAHPKEVREASPLKSNLNNNNNESEITTEKSVIKSYSSDSVNTTRPVISKDVDKKPEPITVVKKSIFDDSESDDDLFSSKSSSNVIASKNNSSSSLNLKPAIPVISSNKEKSKSLFDDESDSDSDLFGGAKGKKIDLDSTSASLSKDSSETNIILPKPELEERDEVDSRFPSSKQPNEEASPLIKPDQDNSKNEDGPKPAKVTGSKISEKIKAMQNAKPEKTKLEETVKRDLSSKKDVKSKISVKSLALNLNINPLAMMGGAKPPKAGGSVSTPSTPDREISDPPSISDVSLPGSPDKSNTEESIKKISIGSVVEKTGGVVENDSVMNESSDGNHEQPSASTNQKFGGVDELVGILKVIRKATKFVCLS